MFFLAGIFSALMLSGLVVMIDSDDDGRFEDKEDLRKTAWTRAKRRKAVF